MIIATHGIIASQLAGFDADAQAFFDRVTTAGGSLSATEKTAVNTLVLDLKGYSIWTKMKAIYPMVGGGSGTTAARQAACSQNLKSSSFTGTFTATGWTYASTGVTGNGTSAYMNTGFNPNTQLTYADSHISLYKNSGTISTTDRTNGVYDATSAFLLNIDRTTTVFTQAIVGSYSPGDTSIQGTSTYSGNGFYLAARNANNFVKLTKNNTNTLTNTNTSSPTTYPNDNVWLGAAHQSLSSIVVSPNNYTWAFMSMGNYLDTTQASNFYTAVQAFQTTLSRQV